MKTIAKIGFSTLALLFAVSCAKKDGGTSAADIKETGQQIGDVMASIDEASGSDNGAFAFVDLKASEKLMARVLPPETVREQIAGGFLDLKEALLPRAEAVSCYLANTFGSCTNNQITRTFNGCTIGTAVLSGSIDLLWSDAGVDNTCAMTANTHSITRSPNNFTISGPRGGTLTVSKSGTIGQRITRDALGVFSFTNDGIRREIALNGTTLFDFTTITTGALTITGASRNGRTLTSTGGAALRVTNNASSVSCDFTPTNVTWSSSCTCAVSGSWAATCTDGKSSSLTINGCGTGIFSMGSDSETVVFDRCY